MNNKSVIGEVFSWLFGTAVFIVGLINTFWGNDPGFGIFLILLSSVYFPPVNTFFKKTTALSVPVLLKVFLGIFIIWASLGVGELFDKVDLMMLDL